MEELLNKLEALLFASGRKMELKELAKLCGFKDSQKVKEVLFALQQKYAVQGKALKLVEEGESWKLSVTDSLVPLVRNIVTETELSKSIMETLAVIAWKNPALQCNIIQIRTNKAYDHLDQLEESGYITRVKSGRTRKISLTEKFFTYFDLPNAQKAHDAFKKYIPDEIKAKIEAAEADIMSKEKIIEDDEIKKKLDDEKQKQLKVYEDKALKDVSNVTDNSLVDSSAPLNNETTSQTIFQSKIQTTETITPLQQTNTPEISNKEKKEDLPDLENPITNNFSKQTNNNNNHDDLIEDNSSTQEDNHEEEK